ncbi:MAG: alpha/beta hydrolase [Candidatus Izemoplasmatales bacterium]|nr:alpha/beta hydrolase [Candidatus Izemoplasmatales bacterium]
MKSYAVKPEFEKFKKFHMPRSLCAMKFINFLLKITNLFSKNPKSLRISKETVITRDNHTLAMTMYSPLVKDQTYPCLLYFPGGGFMMGANLVHKSSAATIASQCNCHVILVHYRLAPKHLFPTALYDTVDATIDIHRRAKELWIDPTRIALAGDSSGGSLVAGTLMMLRDFGGPTVCFQMLLYPALNKLSANYTSRRKFKETPVFNTRNFAFINKIVYKNGYFGLKEYAYPLLNPSFDHLPPAYIETAEFDCLHDDGVRYASILQTKDIPVTLFETMGTFHGYDAVSNSLFAQFCMKKRLLALQVAFK